MYIRRLFRIHFRMCLRICNRVCICVMLRIPSMCFCVCVCCYVCECVFGFLCAQSEGRSQPWHSIARWRAEGSAGRNKCTARERRCGLARCEASSGAVVQWEGCLYTHTHTPTPNGYINMQIYMGKFGSVHHNYDMGLYIWIHIFMCVPRTMRLIIVILYVLSTCVSISWRNLMYV